MGNINSVAGPITNDEVASSCNILSRQRKTITTQLRLDIDSKLPKYKVQYRILRTDRVNDRSIHTYLHHTAPPARRDLMTISAKKYHDVHKLEDIRIWYH